MILSVRIPFTPYYLETWRCWVVPMWGPVRACRHFSVRDRLTHKTRWTRPIRRGFPFDIHFGDREFADKVFIVRAMEHTRERAENYRRLYEHG